MINKFISDLLTYIFKEEKKYYFKKSHNFTPQNSLHAIPRCINFYVVFIDVSFAHNRDS